MSPRDENKWRHSTFQGTSSYLDEERPVPKAANEIPGAVIGPTTEVARVSYRSEGMLEETFLYLLMGIIL